MLLLIHCGYGSGQAAITSERRCHPGDFVSLLRGRNERTDGLAGNRRSSFAIETLNAQSSGLTSRSSGSPKLEIPNGLGLVSLFGAPQFVLAMIVQFHRQHSRPEVVAAV